MHRSSSRYYFCCQAIGWSTLTVTILIANHIVLRGTAVKYLPQTILFTLAGILFSHLLRSVIHHYHWLNLPLRQRLTILLPATLIAAAAAGETCAVLPDRLPMPNRFVAHSAEYLFIFLPWLMIYLLIHHVRQDREDAKKRRYLESILLERRSSQTAPHLDIEDLTSSLEQVRSMIDNDPERSRNEITKFSRLLRTGYLKS